ncbi:MAG: hypothetical protein KatS3mg005_3428 [Bryobacteraceae bacterium]|nr:MAG: hypothetical protein KatS3mg005_3428 [Bryobacteraceae bacterium]
MHVFSDSEARLMRDIVTQHREAVAQLGRVELALRVSIAALCAAHGLDGDWRLADDLSGLVPVDARMHEGEAEAQVHLKVVEGGRGGEQ